MLIKSFETALGNPTSILLKLFSYYKNFADFLIFKNQSKIPIIDVNVFTKLIMLTTVSGLYCFRNAVCNANGWCLLSS